jgi:hypothetical protein
MASASTSRPTSPMGGPRPRSTDPEDFVVVDPNESYASSSVVLLDDRSALVTSWAMSPFLLGSIRLLAGTYALLTVCVNLGFNVSLRRTGDSYVSQTHSVNPVRPWLRLRYFSYFTNLSLIGLVAYLIAAAVQTLCYWKRTREGRSGYPLVDKWPRPFLVLHMVLMSTIATFREFFYSFFFSFLWKITFQYSYNCDHCLLVLTFYSCRFGNTLPWYVLSNLHFILKLHESQLGQMYPNTF